MPGIAQEGAGVGEHPVERPHIPQRHQAHHLGLHPRLVVVEPPGRALLHLAGDGAVRLERPHNAADGRIVRGIQGVQDGLAQRSRLLQRVQQTGQTRGIWLVVDGVKSGVRTQLFEHGGGIVPDAAEMKLHHPVPLGVLLPHRQQQGGVVSKLLLPRDALPRLGPRENIVQLGLVRLHAEAVVQRVVGHPAAVLVEILDPLRQRPAHIAHRLDGVAHHLFQPGHVLGEVRLVRAHGLVRAERRQHRRRRGRVRGQQLVGLQIVRRVVGGADQLHVGPPDDLPHRQLLELLIALLVNLHGVVPVQGLGDAEVPLELQVRPVIQRIADQVGHGLRPLLELLRRRRVPRDILLRHPAGAHGTPLVVVSSQPHLRDAVVPLVLIDLHRIDVAVVVDDRHLRPVLVVQPLAGLGLQEKVFVHKGNHIDFPPILFGTSHGNRPSTRFQNYE